MRKIIALLLAAFAFAAGATVPSETNYNTYVCNGTQTVYPYTYKIFTDNDLVVTTLLSGTTTTLVKTTDYTVSGAGLAAGGNVTLTAGSKCANGATITIKRQIALRQPTSFRTQGTFSPAVHENAFDRGVMQAQQEERTRAAEDALIRAEVATSALGGGVNIADNSTVQATGAVISRTLSDHLSTLPDFRPTGSGAITPLKDHVSGWRNVRASGVKCDGVTDDRAAFEAAAADAVAEGATLLVSCKVRFTSSAVFETTANIRFIGGGSLDLQTGGSVVLSGSLDAPLSRIFWMNGGTLTFSAKVAAVYPQWWGAVGDGVTDDTAAIQAAVDALPTVGVKSGRLQVPCGDYVVSGPIDITAATGAEISGDGFCSYIHGNVNGFILDRNNGALTGPTSIRGLRLVNTHTGASTGAIRQVGSHTVLIQGNWITGHYGVFTGNAFTVDIAQNILRGPTGDLSSVGVLSGGHANIIGNDITAWGEGIRVYGTTVNVQGNRFEINFTGMTLGRMETGVTMAISRCLVSGNSMEANDVAIDVWAMNFCMVSGIAHQGSVNSPSANSSLGLNVRAAVNSSFSDVSMGGTYTDAAIRISPSSLTHVTFSGVQAQNSYYPGTLGAMIWDVRGNLDAGVTFLNCGPDLPGTGATANPTFMNALSVPGLSSFDWVRGNKKSRNLRGKDVPVGSAATTVAILFPNSKSANQAGFNGAGVPTTGGTLVPGTYYYSPTFVTELGESSALESSVVIAAPNNAVTWAFFGTSGTNWRRRVYRGRSPGVYDGYYELPIDSTAPFTDVGAAFSGTKNPPVVGVASPSGEEPDANYSITCTPQWNATCWVSAKATTGFTLNFSAAPGGSGSFVDWHLIR